MIRPLITAAALALLTTTSAVAAPAETAKPLLQQPLPEGSGRTFTAARVDFAPGAKAAAHRHGQAFVFAYVLTGEVRSQLEVEPAKVYRTGESWFEPPGAHHTVTENTSATAPAALLVTFIAASGSPLKTEDKPR